SPRTSRKARSWSGSLSTTTPSMSKMNTWNVLLLGFMAELRTCAKSSAGQEAYFEQNAPHPDPLPSDGRGNSQIRLLHLLHRLDRPPDGGRFSLSHPMGEGRGEGEYFSKSEVVFARVLRRRGSRRVLLALASQHWAFRTLNQMQQVPFAVLEEQDTAAAAGGLDRFLKNHSAAGQLFA